MNEELARRAKQYARKHDRTFTQVIEEAVMRLLADGTAATAPRKPIILPTVGDPSNPITEEQYRQAIEEMYEDEARGIIEGGRASPRR